ncbi:hypothetical protein DFJ74DRAFT_653476 [Hyaloraphidium curvatum]|nr:hypothetical protein DFJ74DRAFT_653476 [Hyaloraphidium curvatum]
MAAANGASDPDLQPFFDWTDAHAADIIDLLAEAVAIPSVSGEKVRRPEVIRMVDWTKEKLEKLGVKVEIRPNPLGFQTIDDEKVPLPPIILGTYGNDPKKPTVCVYGHLDVQPAFKSDGWDTEPFKLTEKNGKLYARGATDDKGPVLCWLWVIKAHQELKKELPVNLKMVFEAMEESGSEGLDEVILAEANGFLKDVDCVTISDNYWLGTTKPCITYGLRGITYFTLAVSGPGADLHSGVWGGVSHEPMTDLIKIMASLVEPDGKILIPGIYDDVAPVSPEEKAIYERIELEMSALEDAIGAKTTIHDSVVPAVMARWRYPSLSLHGIEGAFYGAGAKTVIPAKVIGKFSIRLVPDQDPEKIHKLVKAHVESEFAKLKSRNKIKLSMGHGAKAWVGDFKDANFTAGIKATEKVWGITPDLTREGGSIPVTLTFADATGKSVMLLPVGQGDDGAHSTNEKVDRKNLINGVKTLGAYLHYFAALRA